MDRDVVQMEEAWATNLLFYMLSVALEMQYIMYIIVLAASLKNWKPPVVVDRRMDTQPETTNKKTLAKT